MDVDKAQTTHGSFIKISDAGFDLCPHCAHIEHLPPPKGQATKCNTTENHKLRMHAFVKNS